MQPRNEPKQRQQAGQKSTIYLMLFVFAAMIISALSIDSKANENDWFVYLGTQEAQKAPRKNINAAEALPPLPLPATPLRRTERKKPPQPDYLVGKVIWGQSASFADSTGKQLEIADWNLCQTDTEKFVAQARAMDLQYHWQNTRLAGYAPPGDTQFCRRQRGTRFRRRNQQTSGNYTRIVVNQHL